MTKSSRVAALIGLACSFHALTSAAQPFQNGSTPLITWFPCPQNASWPWSCGNLTVPLDYTNPDSGQYLTLSLVKVNATQQPSKGSILFNPGGPGLIGRDLFAGGAGEVYLNFTGGQYDLISFDPRGTGETLPYYCFGDDTSRSTWQYANPRSTNSSEIAVGTILAYEKTFAETCYQFQNATGELIGTGFVARDMMQIVDALGEDGILRYWGASYGTALGATVAAMYPDRMDKVVLDGVLNTREYYAGTGDFDQIRGYDQALYSFFENCTAVGPEICPVAANSSTPQELQMKIDRLLDELKYQPIALGTEVTDIAEYGYVKLLMVQGIRAPLAMWPNLGAALNAIFTRNLTAWRESSGPLIGLFTPGPTFPNYGVEALYGIRCSDVRLRTDNLTYLTPIVDELEGISRYLGDLFPSRDQLIGCPQWKMNAKGAYEGDFQVTTKNPILLIGNPLDPVTALGGAVNVSSGFKGSVVLQHNGEGHTSISQPSTCTIDAIRSYFVNGTLPAPGTQCYPNNLGFGRTAANMTSPTSSRFRVRSTHIDHDKDFLDAVADIGRRINARTIF